VPSSSRVVFSIYIYIYIYVHFSVVVAVQVHINRLHVPGPRSGPAAVDEGDQAAPPAHKWRDRCLPDRRLSEDEVDDQSAVWTSLAAV